MIRTAFVGVGGAAGAFAATGSWAGTPVAVGESLVVDLTPGFVVASMITLLGDVAGQLALLAGVALTVAVLATPEVGAAAMGRRGIADRRAGRLASALSVGGVVLAATRSPLGAAGAAVVAGATGAVFDRLQTENGESAGRRAILRSVGAAVALLGGSITVGALRGFGGPDAGNAELPGDSAEAAARLEAAREKDLDVDGLAPLVSSTRDFYEVDINSVNPSVDASSWSMSVTGSVLEERRFDLSDLTDLPIERRFGTLRCVGDPLNGQKMDTALWTGVPAEAILEDATPAGSHVMLRAADGYYNEFPIEALEGGLFAFRMNGEPLPRKHGAPMRALVPGHWGEIDVKWLTEIEVLTEGETGYWEKRGWHGTGPVNTVAKLWTRNKLADGQYQVGGHAYAGTRGVERVEVSVDGGESWDDARLSDPLDGVDVWRQWAYEWEPTRKRHEVVVRAIEDNGTVQPRTETDAYPRGASGRVSDVIIV